MRFQLVINGEAHVVETDGGVTVDGRPVAGEAVAEGRGVTVHLGRKRYRVLLTRWGSVVDDIPYRVEVRDLEAGTGPEASAGRGAASVGRVEVRPPMPGRIVRIPVRVGDRVARHAPVAILEAMKMQNEVPAPVAGVVKEVRVSEGQGVLASDVLVVLEPE